MSHKCYIDGSSAACFEHCGELWVKEYSDGRQREGRTYKVNFCPECGFKIPKNSKSFLNFFNIPPDEGDDRISQFSADLGRAIREMNHNIEMIKAFMISQNIQNQCFIDNEMELRKRVSKLEGIK